jgi:POT family proton-dependent oligopeptide transporter
MGINTGGALGPFICGLVGETGNVADFKWAFLAGGIGMLISVIIQAIYHKKYVVDPQQKVLGLTPDNAPGWAKSTLNTAFILLGFSAVTIALIYIDAKVYSYLFYLLIGSIVLIAGIIFTDKTLNSIEKSKVAVIFVVSFFVVFFWSAFEQAGASLTFFADEQTQRVVNFKFPVWLVVSLCAALLAYVVKLFKSVSVGLGSAYDAVLRYPVYALLGLLALGDLYVIKTVLMSGGSSIELVEVPASWFQSLNSMFVVGFAPFFAWLWLKLGKYDPSSPTKMALGLFMLALGYLWIAFGVKDVQPGIKVSMIWLIGMYALHTCGELSLSPIGLSLVNKLAPIKYASLLMAVWFTANAFANKLAGVLSALYPEEGKTRELLGYAISNNYDFFLLFVAMAGVASIILFFLSRKLQGLMKD